MSTIIGGILLLGSITGIILCVTNSTGSSVLVTALLFLTMIIGGVLVFDNGSEHGLKFPDVYRVFGARGYMRKMWRARSQLNKGLITKEEYEQTVKEYRRKYGFKDREQ